MTWKYYKKDQVLRVLKTVKVLTADKIKKKDQVERQKEFMDLLNQRYKKVKSMCAKIYPMTLKSFTYAKHIYWMKSQHIAYCPSFKSATSTWLNNLIQISNYPKEEKEKVKLKYPAFIEQLRRLGAINPDNRKWLNYISRRNETDDFIGFMVVRHPFDRLVSAYRDKIERDNSWYHPHFGKYFVQKYRRQAIKVLGKDFFNQTNNFGTVTNVPQNRRPSSEFASFWEFAQAVIDRYKMDEHWMPISSYCSICSPINIKAFRYYLKFEYLEREEELFIKRFHWDDKINKTERINENNSNKLSGNDLTRLYFSILSKEQIKGLYNVYKQDFLLFDYKFSINDLQFPM